MHILYNKILDSSLTIMGDIFSLNKVLSTLVFYPTENYQNDTSISLKIADGFSPEILGNIKLLSGYNYPPIVQTKLPDIEQECDTFLTIPIPNSTFFDRNNDHLSIRAIQKYKDHLPGFLTLNDFNGVALDSSPSCSQAGLYEISVIANDSKFSAETDFNLTIKKVPFLLDKYIFIVPPLLLLLIGLYFLSKKCHSNNFEKKDKGQTTIVAQEITEYLVEIPLEDIGQVKVLKESSNLSSFFEKKKISPNTWSSWLKYSSHNSENTLFKISPNQTNHGKYIVQIFNRQKMKKAQFHITIKENFEEMDELIPKNKNLV